MWQNNAASLRQAFNGSPLKKDLSNLLYLQNHKIENLDLHRLKAWDNYGLYVEDSTESLLSLLHESITDREFNDPNYLEQYQNKISLAAGKLENLSAIAYLTGLSLLSQLDASNSELKLALINLKYLQPRTIPSQPEIDLLLADRVKFQEQLLLVRAEIVRDAEILRDRKLQEYADLDRMLDIHPTDTQAEVVGKAVALRQLGRIEEAIDAYDCYGKMFPDAEPPTRQYVATAKAFTRQIEVLDVAGGIYIYRVDPSSLAQRSGLIVGDIIVNCGQSSITRPNEMASALTATADDTSVDISYLRLEREGYFSKVKIAIEGRALGIDFVGI